VLKILVIVPCYNEEKNISKVVSELKKQSNKFKLDILIVDDGSKDDTWEISKQLNVNVVRLSFNVGIGAAIQTGFKFARQYGYDGCFQIDGDGQHPSAQLCNFIDFYETNKTNLIIGSRFIENEGFQSTFLRRFGIFLIKGTIKLMSGTTVTDPTSGLRFYDRLAIKIFSENYPHDYPEPVSIQIAKNYQLDISELPVTMREREHGTSSIYGVRNILYMISVIINLLLRIKLKPRRRHDT
jgi:glycosyltransferase involved in cell wall biosynthesis